MAEAVDLTKMHGAGEVDAALEAAADVERLRSGLPSGKTFDA